MPVKSSLMKPKNTKHLSKSAAQTQEIGYKLGKSLKKGHKVILKGDLGAGKTTLTKGIAKAFGIKETEVKSPTYTLVRELKSPKIKIYHYDFYRLNQDQVDEILLSTLEEIAEQEDALVIIEWPERLPKLKSKNLVEVNLIALSADEREIKVTFHD